MLQEGDDGNMTRLSRSRSLARVLLTSQGAQGGAPHSGHPASMSSAVPRGAQAGQLPGCCPDTLQSGVRAEDTAHFQPAVMRGPRHPRVVSGRLCGQKGPLGPITQRAILNPRPADLTQIIRLHVPSLETRAATKTKTGPLPPLAAHKVPSLGSSYEC